MNYLYMNEQGQQVQYYQFPKFLLELPLSQNARIIYMLLYDRARISRKIIGQMRTEEYMQYFQLKNYHRKPGSVNLLLKRL